MKKAKKTETKKTQKAAISGVRDHAHPVDPEKEVVEELKREGKLFWRDKAI